MALSVLASRLGRRLPPQLRPVGLVVDHGLRPGSAAEAEAVCGWLHKLDLQYHNLRHVYFRYRLLEEACWDRGIGVLLTAHHADDQAELFLMRLARCSGFAGLAGTASTSHRRVQCTECGLPVATLMVCQDAGQVWMEDETNASLVFARNRVRAALCGPSGLCKADIQAVMALCQAARAEVEGLQEQLLLQSAEVAPDGYVTLNTERLFQNAHPPVVEAALSTLMQARHTLASSLQVKDSAQYTSQKKPPRHSSIKQVVRFLASKQAKGALMVAGCLFHKHGSAEEVTVSRCPDPRRSAAVHVSLAQIAAAKRPFVVHLDSKFLVSVDFDTQVLRKLRTIPLVIGLTILVNNGLLHNCVKSARWALPAVVDEAGNLLSLPVKTSVSKHNAEFYFLLRSAVRSAASSFFQVHLRDVLGIAPNQTARFAGRLSPAL
eukprot:SM000060S19597  [mRNA]  locus=s60:63774:68183:+ [translate_table: standard]